MRNLFLIFLIFLITFQNYFYSLLPIELFGISIYLFIFLISTFLIFFYDIKKQSLNSLVFFCIYIFFFIVFSFFRDWIYNSNNFIGFLSSAFSWYLVPIFIMISYYINKKSFNGLYSVFIIILTIQSVLALFFVLGLPTINILSESLPFNYLRYVGIMGGANVNANFNVLLASILILSPTNFKNSTKLIILIMALLSAIPSISRLSIIVILLLIFYLLRNLFFKNNFNKLGVILLLIISIFLIFDNSEVFDKIETVNKISETIETGSDQVRYNKYSYGMKILFSDLGSALIGPPSEMQISRNIEFSDNSYLHMALELGIPMFLVFLIFIIYLIKKANCKNSIELKIYFFIFLVTCFLNNSIIWIPWLFIFFLGFRLIGFNVKTNEI